MRKIALLGSTGSIGRNTLDVMAQNRDQFKLIAIAAGESIDLLAQQIETFTPQVVSVKNKQDAETLRERFPGVTIYHGSEGLVECVSHPEVDTMVSAIDGTTALEATLESIRRNHRICLANKETLVAAGELINRYTDDSEAEIIPIDSEQSAIFQSIGHNNKEGIRRVILTASGGPFYRRVNEHPDPFAGITVKDALAHPTWNMGAKVTIDSATLMNKGLEVIEAFYLFRLAPGQIDVVIHPQSIVHSMVEFIDSSVIAQLSVPDMRLPILYSLSYPQRITFNNSRLDFSQQQKLEFFDVNREAFTSIQMAFDVLKEGKNAGAILNAANEVAVEYFLREQLTFKEIFGVVGEIFYRENFYQPRSVEDILETIRDAKAKTLDYIEQIKQIN